MKIVTLDEDEPPDVYLQGVTHPISLPDRSCLDIRDELQFTRERKRETRIGKMRDPASAKL